MTFQRDVTKGAPKVSLIDLSRVGRGTPAGDWFRRYRLAIGVAGELRDIPRAVTLLGEGVAEILKRTPGKEAREREAGEFVDNSLLKDLEQSGWFKKLGD